MCGGLNFGAAPLIIFFVGGGSVWGAGTLRCAALSRRLIGDSFCCDIEGCAGEGMEGGVCGADEERCGLVSFAAGLEVAVGALGAMCGGKTSSGVRGIPGLNGNGFFDGSGGGDAGARVVASCFCLSSHRFKNGDSRVVLVLSIIFESCFVVGMLFGVVGDAVRGGAEGMLGSFVRFGAGVETGGALTGGVGFAVGTALPCCMVGSPTSM